MNERELFLSALEFEDNDARRQYLRSQCGSDDQMLARIESLLDSHDSQSEFLNQPAMEQIVGGPADEIPTSADSQVRLNRESADASFSFDRTDAIRATLLPYLQPAKRSDSFGRLGHYEFQEIVGSGAFGIVVKAFDAKLQRVVAIKVLAPHVAVTSPARKRFLREARSSAQVRHENVVNIYAVEDDPIPFLVMEYVPGETLQQRLNGNGPLELREVLRLGQQIAAGLAAAHAQGLIHRDVKPGNILIDSNIDNKVKITDFGLARAADDASMSQSGVIAGTPLYMAPEQTLGEKLDQRADLFSLGSVLYQMLSGRPPFRAPTTVAVLKRVAEDQPRPIQELIPEIPEWMCDIVRILHAKNPGDRFASAQQVSDLLSRCSDDLRSGRRPEVQPPDGAMPRLAERPDRRAAIGRRLSHPIIKVAAALLLVFGILSITEAAEVTKISKTIFRIITSRQETFLVEVDDPNTRVTVDGELITITNADQEQLLLTPNATGKTNLLEIRRDGQEKMAIRRENVREDLDEDKHAKISPFYAIRWDGDQPEVLVSGTWYKLAAIQGTPAEKIVQFCQTRHDTIWIKRFEEDLVQVMSEMGQPLSGNSVDLSLIRVDSGEKVELRDVPMTRENRQRHWRSREDRRQDENAKTPPKAVPVK